MTHHGEYFVLALVRLQQLQHVRDVRCAAFFA
jgi:hypothetical protein